MGDMTYSEKTALGPWSPHPEDPSCCMRVVVGGSLYKRENRYAFIEKTPRVRIRLAEALRVQNGRDNWAEWLDWCQGPKGSPSEQMPDGTWQYDIESQRWCDRMLKALGFDLIADTDVPEADYDQA